VPQTQEVLVHGKPTARRMPYPHVKLWALRVMSYLRHFGHFHRWLRHLLCKTLPAHCRPPRKGHVGRLRGRILVARIAAAYSQADSHWVAWE
jgi:hypothetical protein